MIIINQTFNVDESILDEWMAWVKKSYLPEVMASGHFTDNKMLRLLSEEITNGNTFAIQFSMPSATYVNEIDETFYTKYDQMASRIFGDKVLFFRTVLEVIN